MLTQRQLRLKSGTDFTLGVLPSVTDCVACDMVCACHLMHDTPSAQDTPKLVKSNRWLALLVDSMTMLFTHPAEQSCQKSKVASYCE